MANGTHAAQILRALGHPVRLEILRVLVSEGEACVCHLEARLGLRQAYLSQQLSRLRSTGLVVDRREGLNVFYRLASPAIRRVLEAADGLTATLGTSADSRTTPETVRDQRERPCPCPRCQPVEQHVSAAVTASD